jgi:hypothetical protein
MDNNVNDNFKNISRKHNFKQDHNESHEQLSNQKNVCENPAWTPTLSGVVAM